MKTGYLRWRVLAVGALACSALLAQNPQTVSQRQGLRSANPFRNPKPFQNNLASPSAPIRFLLSETGKQLVAASNHPNLRGLFAAWGVELPKPAALLALPRPFGSANAAIPAAASVPCSSPTGAVFNLEGATGSPEIGFPVPQNQESVDYLPAAGLAGADLVIESGNDYRGLVDTFLSPNGVNGQPFPNAWGFGMTGYYVHRAGSDCSPAFEGALPHVYYSPTNEVLYGGGDGVVAADATRAHVYAVDLRYGATVTGIGLFRTSAQFLDNPQLCPEGTHLTDSNGFDSAASRCWPIKTLLNPVRTIFPSTFSDKPHLRVDERASGTGAGDVYISWTNFDLFHGVSAILIAACPASFTSAADCSPPMMITGQDSQTQFSHLAVRPDNGLIVLTYVNVHFIDSSMPPYFSETFDIKYVSCIPQGAPNPPICARPLLVTTEQQPMPLPPISLAANSFTVATYPTHDVRWNGAAFEDFIVWTRCAAQVFFSVGNNPPLALCPDAKLAMTWSPIGVFGNPQGWASVTAVGARPHDQFSPWVRADYSRNIIEIAYLTSEKDHFGHRLQVFTKHLDPGSYVFSDQTDVVTPSENDPSADFLFRGGLIGDHIGIIPRSHAGISQAYAGFAGNNSQGIVQGILIGDQNNMLGRFDY